MRRAAALFAAAKPPTRSRLQKPAISLDQFIQRQRAIGLWREIVRATQKVSNPTTRKELRDYARQEFERNRHVSDLAHIRYLISTGKTEFNAMRRYVDEQA
ncbi:hypothetical protein VTO42DRAFT_4904 [Malbranchea cinnamomea]